MREQRKQLARRQRRKDKHSAVPDSFIVLYSLAVRKWRNKDANIRLPLPRPLLRPVLPHRDYPSCVSVMHAVSNGECGEFIDERVNQFWLIDWWMDGLFVLMQMWSPFPETSVMICMELIGGVDFRWGKAQKWKRENDIERLLLTSNICFIVMWNQAFNFLYVLRSNFDWQRPQ